MSTDINQGVRATVGFSTNREDLDFAEGIALLDPNQNPFTLMTMQVAKGVAMNVQHFWLEDELQPETDTCAAATTGQTDITVTHCGRFAKGDLVRVNGSNEVMLVTDTEATTSAAGTITVTRDYGQGSTPGWSTALADDIASGSYLTILGNAFEQGYGLSTIKGTVPNERYNYCQDIRTSFGMSDIVKYAMVHGENEWALQKRKKAIEHMRMIEYVNMFGRPVVGDKGIYASATGNTAPTAAGGLHYFLDTYCDSDRKINQSELTLAEFQASLEAIFEYGSGAKVAYCAPMFRSALDWWGISKQTTFVETEIGGIKVARWVSSHGEITFVTHKMLKDPGSDGAYCFIVDPSNIRWITLNAVGDTTYTEIDKREKTFETKWEGEYRTVQCMEVKQPNTHGMIYGVTSYAA